MEGRKEFGNIRGMQTQNIMQQEELLGTAEGWMRITTGKRERIEAELNYNDGALFLELHRSHIKVM